MVENYHIDLKKFPLEKFKGEIWDSNPLPSRKMLKDHLDERFKILKENKVDNLQDLASLLKNPKKAREFAEKSGLPEDYLLILRREVNSYTPNPVNLDKFPGVEEGTLIELKSAGIKNSLHLFKRVKTLDDREKLANELGIDEGDLLELTKLTDLVRIKWVGPVFARIFLDSETDTSQKVSEADAKTFYQKLVDINSKKHYTKSKFTLSNVELCVKIAGMVPKVIEY
ncbi:DUF4332 domain-containing protein [Methanobacterium formicicum]|uniref:DUF4332 domain-containing protein n=1 Tax=Methanobacterium formicicum (strain DSM 3637 / PP1) TaxID=1204725 RepID=K2RVE5_METFP|nr:DUF4332 domain-containing protein [Methanobacterium formicicum]EKF86740.1 hypothetical protein A994_00600 [Methanobacterium formicicum DSM 3637]